MAYIVPGLFGRDPWKNADITAFGYMAALAQGATSWTQPLVGGLRTDSGVLSYWLGALFIQGLSPFVSPALAARIPFALLLGLALMLTWYATYHLARNPSALPLPLAFGGEAQPKDYGRAVADGSVLAMIATLGLLQLGHETTPELLQLFSVSLFLYGLAAFPFRKWKACAALLLPLPLLAMSGGPSIALALGVGSLLACWTVADQETRPAMIWIVIGAALAALAAWGGEAWAWRIADAWDDARWGSILRLLAWFPWPGWLLALWTLWRWRRHWRERHILFPVIVYTVSLGASLAMGGADRALMLGIPALACLAAFALPTLGRTTSAAIDWFSVLFYSLCASTVWVVYVALQTGFPRQTLSNIRRLVPGFEPQFSLPALLFAITATSAWIGSSAACHVRWWPVTQLSHGFRPRATRWMCRCVCLPT